MSAASESCDDAVWHALQLLILEIVKTMQSYVFHWTMRYCRVPLYELLHVTSVAAGATNPTDFSYVRVEDGSDPELQAMENKQHYSDEEQYYMGPMEGRPRIRHIRARNELPSSVNLQELKSTEDFYNAMPQYLQAYMLYRITAVGVNLYDKPQKLKDFRSDFIRLEQQRITRARLVVDHYRADKDHDGADKDKKRLEQRLDKILDTKVRLEFG